MLKRKYRQILKWLDDASKTRMFRRNETIDSTEWISVKYFYCLHELCVCVFLWRKTLEFPFDCKNPFASCHWFVGWTFFFPVTMMLFISLRSVCNHSLVRHLKKKPQTSQQLHYLHDHKIYSFVSDCCVSSFRRQFYDGTNANCNAKRYSSARVWCKLPG